MNRTFIPFCIVVYVAPSDAVMTLSGLITRQSWGSNYIEFIYDESSQPFAMNYNGTLYYYVLNVQGDVVGLLNTSGALVATYTYDPWGKVISSSGSIASVNPLRYRGYYYDTETGFYYLQTRYYDPAIGRFINADSYATTNILNPLGANMFAYCWNDPVNYSDPSGESARIVVGALVGGTVSAICEATRGGSSSDVIKAFVVGTVKGAISSASKVGKGIITTVETLKTLYECRTNGVPWGESLLAAGATFYSSLSYITTDDLLTDAVVDLTWGLGNSLISTMITDEIIKNNKSETKQQTNANIGQRYVKPADQYRYQINPYIVSTAPR